MVSHGRSAMHYNPSGSLRDPAPLAQGSLAYAQEKALPVLNFAEEKSLPLEGKVPSNEADEVSTTAPTA